MELNAEQIQVCTDRLRGNGAWNGNGLLVFLATTSRKDREREWMEPLKDLCEKIVYGVEDGAEISLTDEESAKIDEMVEYSRTFHAAIGA